MKKNNLFISNFNFIIVVFSSLLSFSCSNSVEQINVEDLKTPCEHVDAFQNICNSLTDKDLLQQLSEIEKKLQSSKDTLTGNDFEIVSRFEKSLKKAQEILFHMKKFEFTTLEVEACNNSKKINENSKMIEVIFKTTKIILKNNNRIRKELLNNKSNNTSNIDAATAPVDEAPVEESTIK